LVGPGMPSRGADIYGRATSLGAFGRGRSLHTSMPQRPWQLAGCVGLGSS
jgi:hypothetical protein